MKNELNLTIIGENVKLSKNCPPIPKLVIVEERKDKQDPKELRFRAPRSVTDDVLEMMAKAWSSIYEPPIIKFVYDEEYYGSGEELMEFIRKNSETVTGRRLIKADLVFDMEIETDTHILKFFNLFNTDVNIANDMSSIVLYFVYDYYTLNEKDEKLDKKEDS